jgi:hypothetical protein
MFLLAQVAAQVAAQPLIKTAQSLEEQELLAKATPVELQFGQVMNMPEQAVVVQVRSAPQTMG